MEQAAAPKHESPKLEASKWIRPLCRLSLLLRCLFLFFPGILLLILAMFAFWSLSQGRDVIQLSLETNPIRGVFFILALGYWAFVMWYTGRLVAHNHPANSDAAPGDARFWKLLIDHVPRLLGFSTFTVLIIGLLTYDWTADIQWYEWLLMALVDYALYFLFARLFYLIKKPINDQVNRQLTEGYIPTEAERASCNNACSRLRLYRRIAIGFILLTFVLALVFWHPRSKPMLLAALLIMQLSLLFLVVVRRTAGKCRIFLKEEMALDKGRVNRSLKRIMAKGTLNLASPTTNQDKRAVRNILIERLVFRVLIWTSLIALVCYVAAICSIWFARLMSPMLFVLLAFGVLLGISNLLSFLAKRTGVNWHFVLFFIVFLIGLGIEPHRVYTIALSGVQTDTPFKQRIDLKTYLHLWVNDPVRRDSIAKSADSRYPVFIVLADGGASRSGYWTASVLGHLDTATSNGNVHLFQQHLFCLSGASGGSVGNGTYFAALVRKDGKLIRGNVTSFLQQDFLSFTLARMLGPDLLAPLWCGLFKDRAWALERSLENAHDPSHIDTLVRKGFSNFLPDVRGTFLPPIIFINTTRMQDGRPGVVSNIDIDSISHGTRVDVLDLMEAGRDIPLSTCMIMGARFSYVSPAGRLGKSYFVDGGYFDNSGAGIVHEMLQEIDQLTRDTNYADNALIRKLRFYVLHITNSPYSPDSLRRVHPFKNDLLAPLVTLAGSYSTQTDVNDYRLNNYIDKYNGDTSHLIVNLYRDTLEPSFSMSWVISRRMLDSMQHRTRQVNLDILISRLKNGDSSLFAGFGGRSYPK